MFMENLLENEIILNQEALIFIAVIASRKISY